MNLFQMAVLIIALMFAAGSFVLAVALKVKCDAVQLELEHIRGLLMGDPRYKEPEGY